MKTIAKLLFAFFIIASMSIMTYAQTVNSLWVDGRVYFKISNDAVLNVADVDGEVNPMDVYFLEDLVGKYQITELVMPFKSAKSDVLQRTFRMDFENMSDIDLLLRDLNQHPDIEYAEPAPLFFISLDPNDTYYNTVLDGGFLYGDANSSWHLNLINASAAWDVTPGDAGIVVAVLDNAIWVDHPDLVNKISIAVDLGNGDDDPTPPEATYMWSHGTHSAGLVGAETNNSLGVSSIGNGVSIMAVKLGDDASDGQSMAAGYEGIIWAADNGADVISMSWGSPQFFQTMQNTVNYAYNEGCVLVGAAGNNGNGAETQANPDIPINYVGYPAALDHVIAVGSCDIGDNKSDFSNYGTWIDVLAPGGYATEGLLGLGAFAILSTTYSEAGTVTDMLSGEGGGAATFGVTGNYDLMQGTSMACPVTSGLCGLILSANSDLTPEELTFILKSTCTNVDAQNTAFIDSIGAGRIDALAAVNAATAASAPLVADFIASTIAIPEGGTVDFNDLTTGVPTEWSWTFEGGSPETSEDQNPIGITYDVAGVYQVSLTSGDGTNSDTEIKTAFILVGQSGGVAESAWIEQNTHFTTAYRGVFLNKIVDANTSWVLTYDGAGGGITRDFAVTADAGTTWTTGEFDIATEYAPADISAIDANNAWLAVYDVNGGGGIYYTDDAGATWAQQASAAFDDGASFTNVVHMYNATEGYCQGDPISSEFEIYTTSDGGGTWTLVDGANIPDPESGEMGWTGVADAIGDVAWFGTNTGRVYKSIDKGANWTAYSSGEDNISSISFADVDNGVAICQVTNQTTGAIESWSMIKTNDGGETWTTISTDDQYLSDVSAVPGTPGMYVGVKISQTTEDNFSVYSQDFGTSWTVMDDSVQYTNVVMYDVNTGWAGGFNWDENSGGIYKWPGIAGADDPYFTSSPDLEVIELDTYTYDITCVDPNALALTITPASVPAWLSLTDNGDGTATLTGAAPSITTESEDFEITINVTNGTEDADQIYTLTVVTSNQTPVFTSTPITTHVQNTLYTYDIVANDPDGDDMTITATELPAWATFVDNGDGTAQITGTPTTTSFIGFQTRLNVTDGMFNDIQSFKIQVTANDIVDFGFGSIEVYPNPTTGIIHVVNCQGAEYQIFDITGRILAEGKLLRSDESLNIQEFSDGNFFIRLFSNDEVFTVKLVKL